MLSGVTNAQYNMKNTFFLTTLTVASSCYMQAKAEETTRPNILWLTYEDTSPQFIGCYGNEAAITPTMDAMAADGVIFSNAFSTGTVSSASRFCLITGCRPGRYGTGNHRSAYRLPDTVKGFPEYLREAGYYTSNNVKTDYNHYDATEMASDSWDVCSSSASWRTRATDQPFFAVYNSVHSHQSRTMYDSWSLYESEVLDVISPERITATDGDFEIPECYNDSPDMRKAMSRVYNSISLTDQDFATWLGYLEADGLKESTIIFCFSDHGEGISRFKGSAIGAGHRVPFIVWIPEMYKDLSPWGTGVITEDLVSFDDMAATVLALAGVEIPDYIDGVPFMSQNPDDLVDRAERKKYTFGACDAIDYNIELSRSVSNGDYIYTRVFTPFQPFVRWIRVYDVSDLQRYMRYDYKMGELNDYQSEILEERAPEYLYDIKNDKWELVNLATSDEHQAIVTELRDTLMGYLKETRDANFMPEYTLTEELATAPYELRLDDDYYPFEEILATADLCGMGEDVIDEQIEKLASDNDFVTYWAAIGLFSQKEKLASKVDEVIALLPSLTYPPAQAWASMAVLNVKEDDTARAMAYSLMINSDDQIANNVLNALLVVSDEVLLSFEDELAAMVTATSGMTRYASTNRYNTITIRLGNINEVRQEPSEDFVYGEDNLLAAFDFEDDIVDNMGNITVTNSGATTLWDEERQSNVGSFNKTYLQINEYPLCDNFTIAFWYKRDASDLTSNWRSPFAFYADTDNGSKIYFTPHTSWNDNSYLIAQRTSYSSYLTVAGNSIITSDWVHIAVTFDGRECRVYMDGKLCAYSSMAEEITRFSTILHYLGNHPSYLHYCYMDDIKMYHQTLSDEQVAALAVENADPDSSIKLATAVAISNVSPNPATENFTVQSQEAIDEVSIYTLEGILIQTTTPNASSCTIDCKSWNKGVYFVTVKTAGKVSTTKLIVD